MQGKVIAVNKASERGISKKTYSRAIFARGGGSRETPTPVPGTGR